MNGNIFRLGSIMGIACLNESSVLSRAPSIELNRMNASWYAGSATGSDRLQGGLQVHRAGPSLTILRQSIDLNFEAPFLYLIFGAEKAVLIDSGAIDEPEDCPLQSVVNDLLIEHYGPVKAQKIELIVLHSHAHGDHRAGDSQFIGKAQTRVVSVEEASDFFGIAEWPRDTGAVDLGDRELTILPIPGHEGHDIAVYDPKTAVLFSGDSLYPGRLYIRHWNLYRQSIERLAAFFEDKPLQWILGSHIEMSALPGIDFPEGVSTHPNERALELKHSDLEFLQQRLRDIGPVPRHEKQANFIIMPLES